MMHDHIGLGHLRVKFGVCQKNILHSDIRFLAWSQKKIIIIPQHLCYEMANII